MASYQLNLIFVDLRRTTKLTIPHTNKEMITNFAVNNDTFMGLDLKAGARAAMIPAIKQHADVNPHRHDNDHEITRDPGKVPRDTQNTNVKCEGKPKTRRYPNHRDSTSNRFAQAKYDEDQWHINAEDTRIFLR